jgi:hypothetical protein
MFNATTRKLVLACLDYNILLKAEHISGHLNYLADSLSRFNFQKFKILCPTADERPCQIPPQLWIVYLIRRFNKSMDMPSNILLIKKNFVLSWRPFMLCTRLNPKM